MMELTITVMTFTSHSNSIKVMLHSLGFCPRHQENTPETHLKLRFGNLPTLIHVQGCECVPYGFQKLVSKPHFVSRSIGSVCLLLLCHFVWFGRPPPKTWERGKCDESTTWPLVIQRQLKINFMNSVIQAGRTGLQPNCYIFTPEQ